MPSSDSEDFESADEGETAVEKKERKKRLSSSNYSDDTLDTVSKPIKAAKDVNNDPKLETKSNDTDGWDDFEIDNPIPEEKQLVETKESSKQDTKGSEVKSQDTGWDDFGDWGPEEVSNQKEPVQESKIKQQSDPDIKTVTDKLAATASSKGSSWGWGWGVDSLLNSATAGISTLTTQVSQGISSVLESGIGAPDPEELARKNINEVKEDVDKGKVKEVATPQSTKDKDGTDQKHSGEASFPFGSLLSGVTKFVETTGTKVIAGGLDTLETIGKKTMEVLQDGDPGLAKKRAMLGLDPGDKPVLSQILREAKAKAEEEDKIREEKREAKEVHYENLFDDFEGLVHLEALEMLSKQVSMRIDERMRGLDPDKKQDVKETLQQVAELCEIPEDEEDDEEVPEDQSKPDAFHERLQTATQDLGLKLQFQHLVKQYTDILDWLRTNENVTEKVIYKKAVSSLAQATALAVEVYHKTAEMLLVKTRRSTADEADALTQMTVVLTKHVGELATLFTIKLNSLPTENKEQINNYTTNIFLESGNSSTYIQNAFQLALPILQIGAV